MGAKRDSKSLGLVAFVVPDLHKEASGVAPAVIELASELANQGASLSIHTLEPTPRSLPGLASQVDLRVYPRSRLLWRLGRSRAMFRGLTAACREAQILHVHGLWMLPNIYPAAACRGSAAKVIVSPHGTLTRWSLSRSRLRKQAAWYLLGQRHVLNRASLFHATSEGECEDIRRLGYQIPIALIPNGVMLREVPKPRRADGVKTLLFLSRIHPKKGLDLLLRAWGRLQGRYQDWRIEVVGPDNEGYLTAMQELAVELRLERIEFRGPLFGNDKLAAYANADAYVLPSWSENFGYTVAEALAAGTPVITTRETPWSVLEREGCGWWIDTGLDSLTVCLDEVLSTPRPVLDRLGAAGKDWVRQELAWAHIGERMITTYRWLLGRHDRPDWIFI